MQNDATNRVYDEIESKLYFVELSTSKFSFCWYDFEIDIWTLYFVVLFDVH